MKRIIKILLIFPVIFLILIPAAGAEEYSGEDLNEIYSEQLEGSGAFEIFDDLPAETREYIYDIGLDPGQLSEIESLKAGNIFLKLFGILTDRIKAPFLGALSILAVVLIGALSDGAGAPVAGEQLGGAFGYIGVLVSSAAILVPLMSTVETARRAIEAAGIFTAGLVPVFAGMLIAAGKVTTAAGMSGVLLGAAEAVTQVAAGIATPVTGMFFALSVSGEMGAGVNISGFTETLKRTANYLMTFLLTIFLAVLSIQKTVSAAADSIAAKTTKYFVGTFVPVVGGALGEAVGAVGSSLSLVRATVGGYAILAIFFTVVPVILEISVWRLTLALGKSAAEMFDQKRTASLLSSAGSALSFLFALIVCVGIMFIISLALITQSSGG